MDEINLTEAEARELRRVQRKASAITLGLIVMGALGSILGVVAFQVWRASTRGHTAVHVDGDVMFLPAIIVLTAIVILAPQRQGRPANKIELVMANRRERWMPRVLLFEAVLAVLIAGEFVLSQRFSVSLIVLPLILLSFLRFRRPNDELGQAITQQAMAAGFLTAFTALATLVVVAGFAPEWLARLTPLALALPMAVAAVAFALASWRADREA
jgi:hypothetical protein